MLRVTARHFVQIGVAFALLSTTAQAGALEKRSRVELRVGLWNQQSHTATRIGVGGVETTAGSEGTIVALTCAHWMQENLAVAFSFAVLTAEASTRVGSSGVSTHSVSVIPVMLGVRYYLPRSTYRTSWRPYLAASVGPYVGVEAKTEVGWQVVEESRTEASFGGHLGGGLDIQLSRSLMMGANVGYNLMTDFSDSLGGRKNYSGPEFGIGISFLFGRGIE